MKTTIKTLAILGLAAALFSLAGAQEGPKAKHEAWVDVHEAQHELDRLNVDIQRAKSAHNWERVKADKHRIEEVKVWIHRKLHHLEHVDH